MHQMIRNMANRTQHKSAVQYYRQRVAGFAFAFAALMCGTNASAQVTLADYDMEASGFVTPAGMLPIHTQMMQVGYASSCDAGSCDGAYGAMGCGPMGCGQMGCGDCMSNGNPGGILGKMQANRCGNGCGGDSPFEYFGGAIAGTLASLGPYEGAKLCEQRWYDLSLEALVLDRQVRGAAPSVITTQGSGPTGVPVLRLGDISSSLEGGVRISGAFIFGPGGNIELTYMGSNEWNDSASVTSTGADLFSFISGFGTTPAGGFDDTDSSVVQSLESSAIFHSTELNYRQRTMSPGCSFQTSWLVGLRAIRYDDDLIYRTRGLDINTGGGNLPTFFISDTQADNKLFGPQAGFDFWWNVHPAVSLGFGSKSAWMQNDTDRRTTITANSVPTGGGNVARVSVSAENGDKQGTLMHDLELKMIYRMSHSLTVRGSYYALAIEDISYGGLDPNTQYPTAVSTLVLPGVQYDSLVLQGFTVGAEYMW